VRTGWPYDGAVSKVNADSPTPPYMQVAEDLRFLILSAQMKPGQRLKSGRDLAREYDEFLIESWPGRGVFVATELPTAEEQDRELQEARINDLFDQFLRMHGEIETLKQRVAQLERKAGTRSGR
jgi:DNA-binding transcriptional regulator YhcF (GntR family)